MKDFLNNEIKIGDKVVAMRHRGTSSFLYKGEVIGFKGHFVIIGKIEDGEIPKQTAIREMKEETGIDIKNLKYKGIMTIEYPDRKFLFDIFISNECEGEPQEFEDNTSEWIDIKELLQKEKILSNIMILDRFFIKGLIDDNYNFSMHIVVDEQENILDVDYSLEEK